MSEPGAWISCAALAALVPALWGLAREAHAGGAVVVARGVIVAALGVLVGTSYPAALEWARAEQPAPALEAGWSVPQADQLTITQAPPPMRRLLADGRVVLVEQPDGAFYRREAEWQRRLDDALSGPDQEVRQGCWLWTPGEGWEVRCGGAVVHHAGGAK